MAFEQFIAFAEKLYCAKRVISSSTIKFKTYENNNKQLILAENCGMDFKFIELN